MRKISIGIVVLLVITAIFLYSYKDREPATMVHYEVIKKWELPTVLKEVSGISWLDENKIAAVQDEDGSIFIYDLASEKISDRIDFGGDGDYEGVTFSGNTAYVLRSDGNIFAIDNYKSPQPQVTEISSALSNERGIDVEGLVYDKKHHRLLLAVKKHRDEKNYKGVYSVDIKTEASKNYPVFTIGLNDPVLEEVKGNFEPSEIAIHPQSGEYYILDGTNPRLLIMSDNTEKKELHLLKKNDFANPEGMTFHRDRTLYISNEAGDGPANIMQVSLRK